MNTVNDNIIHFDKFKFNRLKRAYNKAVKAKLESFEFDGEEYVVGFAKYLLEYLEGRFENVKEV
jgi:hypothetical protein